MASSKIYWQELTTDSHSSCPKLFYRFSSNKSGYELLLTDLIGLWLTRSGIEDICAYAKDTRTSIDPSESDSQLKVLIQKLEQSLSDGTNVLHRDDDIETESIVLKTTIKLPRPLQPLEWNFYLKPEGAGEMAENILRPSLHEASESKKKLNSLFDIVEQKDHVIAKLLERIENSSIDLSLIFPRITSLKSRKGRITTRDAQAQVPGLAPFKRSSWDNMFRSDSAYAGFEALGLSNLMAGCEKCPKHTARQHEQWLKKLPSFTKTNDQADKMQLDDPEEESGTQTSTDSESDDFETQRRRHSIEGSAKANGTSHDSDSNEERPAKRVKLTSTGPSASQNNKTAQPSFPRSSSPILPPPTQNDLRHNSTVSISSATSEDLDVPTRRSNTGRHGRLGQVGTKSRQNPKPAREPTFPSSDNDDFAPPRPPASSSPPREPKTELMSSSPPPQPPWQKNNNKYIHHPPRSTSIASSLNPPTPPKLVRLGSNKPSRSGTPDTPRRAEKVSSREASIPNTPSRRLGRLGASKNASQAASQSQQIQPTQMMRLEPDEVKADDSDASTASTASTTSSKPDTHNSGPPAPRLSLNESATSRFQTSKGDETVETEKQPGLTAKEKANRRREELKKKIGNTGGVAGGAPAVRKKRKF